MLGLFDLNEYEEKYDTTFTTQNVTDMEAIRYSAAYDFPWGMDIMVVEPGSNIIIQTEFTLGLSEEATATELTAHRTWFRETASHQPEATAWIEEQLDDYLEAPGAEINVSETFGPVCAGFFTLVPPDLGDSDLTDPYFGVATTVGYFVSAEGYGLSGC